MPSHHRSIVARLVSALTASSLAAGALAATAVPAAAAPATELPPLLITEINVDSSNRPNAAGASVDVWEFVEVHNTTDSPIVLAEEGYSIVYMSGSTPKTLAFDPGTTVDAHGTVVFWAYNSTYEGAAALTDDEFREFYAGLGITEPFQLVRLTGQNGLNNSGTSMYLRRTTGGVTSDVAQVTWTGTDKGVDRTVTFGAPTEAGSAVQPVVGRQQAPTPGTVDPAQLALPEPEPEPTDPTPTPTPSEPAPEPSPSPTGPSVPEPGPVPPSDPALDAPILQVTEVAPDTANVGGADAYEFIEVYNASDAPVRFEDFTINYLYLDGSHVVTNSALWPATPADPVIEPGRTLVLWIKNGANQHLTAADFNAHFGSRLTAGVDLVEIHSGGMANGGLRGIQVQTNTGHVVSRADYMNDAQTVADRPIQYRWESGTRQRLVGVDVATPGYVSPEQVPAGLVATPEDTSAPVITDLTGGIDAPDTDDLALELEVTDDRQVRTVALTIADDVGEPTTRHLRFDAPNRYAFTVPAVDLYGKAWVEYTVTASDGTHTSTLGPVRVQLEESEPAPVRLNVADGQHVGGATRVAGTTSGDPAGLSLAIDGEPVDGLTPALEAPALFAFEATNTDAFFRNGVKLGDDVLTIFDEGFYSRIETVTSEVPVERIARGEDLTLGIYAGTKAWPEPDPNENNDDFSAMNLRLALPDGRVLRPEVCAGAGEGQAETVRECPDPATRIGFSDANQVYFLATFRIPDDAFDSLAHTWDTTAVADGEHTVSATAGEQSVTRTVVVDNTAPEITTALVDGETYRGDIEIDAEASDAGSGVASLTATLDGEAITLPHATSSLTLSPGEHTLVLTAKDRLGNTTERTVTFTTPDERPDVALGEPADGATVRSGDVTLSATAGSANGDDLDVAFRKGYAFDAADAEVSAFAGTTTDAAATDRDGATELTGDELAKLVGTDGVASEVSSDTELPYQLFTVDVPDDAGEDGRVRIAWSGSANADAKVLLYVLNVETGRWQEVDRYVTTGSAATEFELGGTVALADHVRDGEVTVLVQHSEGFAGTARSPRDGSVAPFHPDATPRSEYDFTIAWESDTQYYNDNQGQPGDPENPSGWYAHQQAIHRFLLDQRDELNLQYLVHTGDIVDDWDQPHQWANADAAYRALDEAGLPYGVLAGNHDVGGARVDYSNYSQFFGADRFEGNPWYGGQLQDNRGHYDLISVNGVDLLMLYMGWGPGDEQIDWMNEVIARYPERKVWINLHEYMLTTGGLGPIPQRILDEVIAPNPNVVMVSSGHYHDAYTRTDEFDDDGDGVADRTVYSMLFDYQGLPEGGLGYLRLLHFDNTGGADGTGRIVVRTYSPSLDVFNSDDAALNDPPGMQEFEIPYSAFSLEPTTKTLATDSLRVDVLTSETIAAFTGVASGETVSATWSSLEAGEHGWYVVATGPYGGVVTSEVRTFTTSGPALQTGTPVVVGTPRVGAVLRVDPGTWASGTQLAFQWLVDGVPVSGATGRTYKVPASDVGGSVSVRVTGTKDGYGSWSATSAPTEPVTDGGKPGKGRG
ncbi:lamin tail domain-containing protein [Isoptericola variabilis]|uniref:Metallophosphoesterase n=1 Tax=Isoptericola variabilis (strain 225) TaxID=743718 RepID=F6FRD5_ISOV2|nr:lamin tail domain-containing protein [Isoptericola variabilis]AEG43896.1 metallophosphoesterase [Isoptericola variabilis 225]TWH30486.1 putative phosphohydrolases [Isoptericola variabilis J7]